MFVTAGLDATAYPFWRCCQRSRFSSNHRNFFHHHHRLMFNSNHGCCLSMASGSLCSAGRRKRGALQSALGDGYCAASW